MAAVYCPETVSYTHLDVYKRQEEKIRIIAAKIYGAKEVVFTDQAKEQMRSLTENGFGQMPVCMAKTQMSLSDDAKKKGRPQDFTCLLYTSRCV